MTSFIAWLGVDSRGATSMYFASDSRVSWDGRPDVWDCGQKLFASNAEPEIFGFTGYVSLPTSVLNKACTQIDRGLRSSNDQASMEGRVDWLYRLIKREVDQHPNWQNEDFSIFYGVRVGEGMPRKSEFRLHIFVWDSATTSLTEASVPMPAYSAVLRTDGTGKESLDRLCNAWERSDQGNTSRTMFSAFCDALKSGEDPMSGGEPQLVGLYRQGAGRVFGVVTHLGPSFQGQSDTPLSEATAIEWRDTLFQRVDAYGKLLKKAKMHSRPRQV